MGNIFFFFFGKLVWLGLKSYDMGGHDNVCFTKSCMQERRGDEDRELIKNGIRGEEPKCSLLRQQLWPIPFLMYFFLFFFGVMSL